MLGRDEKKHIVCEYIGHEHNCPSTCSRCAIKILETGNSASARGEVKESLRLFKKAAFIEPKYIDAWYCIGKAYGLLGEYNNALTALDKAISIDAQYGDALLEKANALACIGQDESAMTILNGIIDLYDAVAARQLKDLLLKRGVKDKAKEITLSEAIDLMTAQAYKVIKESNLLNDKGKVSTEKAICFKEEFAERTVKLCRKIYLTYGEDKILSESLLTAFYGSICTTLFYYKSPGDFETVFPFDYLITHIDIEKSEEAAERLLGMLSNESAADTLWNVIYPYVQYCNAIISKVDSEPDKASALIDATESAYVMGMLYAMRYHEQDRIRTNQIDISSTIQTKLDKLYEEIEQLSTLMPYGYKNEEIIEAAEGSGYTPEQYREFLHNTYYEKQREYNILIDKYYLSDERPKIIIDSFSDNSSKLSLLDPVEIDLKKRLASTSILSKCRFLTENGIYRFYSCEFSMLREEKKSGAIVYFGHSASPACIYHDKLYWYEHGSILSDKYIYRCNVEDGRNMEKYEWLSNEKTGEVMGHSYHIISEDMATSMTLEEDILIITVQRKSIENGKYIIKVEDDGRTINVSKHILSGNFTSSKDFSSFSKI